MSNSSRYEFDTLASLIDNLKDVARLQQLAETLADNQRDLAESFSEHRELYAERWAAFADLSRRVETTERANNDLQARIERRAAEMVSEVVTPAQKLLDRIAEIERTLSNNGQVSTNLHAEVSHAVSEFQKKIDELHKKIAEHPGDNTASSGVTRFTYGKAGAAIPNYLIVIFLILLTVWSLSPVGRHMLDKYLPADTLKVKPENKGATP